MDATAVFLFLLQVVHVFTDEVSYKNYRIYDVYEQELRGQYFENENLRVLKRRYLLDDNENVYTVKSYLVPGSEEEDFVRSLNEGGFRYNVSVQDLGKSIEEEKRSNERQRRTYGDTFLDHGKYFTYDNVLNQMTTFLNYIKTFKNPGKKQALTEVEVIGTSTEGRNLYLVKISTDFKPDKKIALFEAGIHGREWTSPCAALYMISQLVENFEEHEEVLKNINIYVMPMTNPDGYEYSRTVDRMWRKTRSAPHGVDGNRNFDFHWGQDYSSSRPESDYYKGPHPFSEPETRAIRNMGERYKRRVQMYVAIHAFGPYITYPWNHRHISPANWVNEMNLIAQRAVVAMKKFSGTQYVIGLPEDTIYPAFWSGDSDDYFKGVIKVDFTFTFHLSHADTFSFLVPNDKLLDICRESFIGFTTMAKHAV